MERRQDGLDVRIVVAAEGAAGVDHDGEQLVVEPILLLTPGPGPSRGSSLTRRMRGSLGRADGAVDVQAGNGSPEPGLGGSRRSFRGRRGRGASSSSSSSSLSRRGLGEKRADIEDLGEGDAGVRAGQDGGQDKMAHRSLSLMRFMVV